MTAIPIQSSARWRRDGQLLRDAKSMGTEHLAELSTKLSGLRCSEPDTTTFYGCFMRYIGNLSEAQQYAAVANLRLVTAAYISELCGVFPHQSFADDGCAAPSTRGSKKVRRRGHCIKALAARPPTSMQLTRRRALCRACFHAVRPTRA
jgi:hypothetical protein